MSNQRCKILVPPPVSEPRGAVWAAAAWHWLQGRIDGRAAQGAHSPAELLAVAREVEPEAPCLAADLRMFALRRLGGPAAAHLGPRVFD